jgi:hypothetical protein
MKEHETKTDAYASTLRTTTKDTDKAPTVALRHGETDALPRSSELITY